MSDSYETMVDNCVFLRTQLAECDRLRQMAVEAAANFKKGAICADCTGDGGSDYPHANDRAREALNAALEANRKYEEGKWSGIPALTEAYEKLQAALRAVGVEVE